LRRFLWDWILVLLEFSWNQWMRKKQKVENISWNQFKLFKQILFSQIKFYTLKFFSEKVDSTKNIFSVNSTKYFNCIDFSSNWFNLLLSILQRHFRTEFITVASERRQNWPSNQPFVRSSIKTWTTNSGPAKSSQS